MGTLQEITDLYRAKKDRWDRLVEGFLALPPGERREFIAKLIILEEADTRSTHPPDGGDRKLRLVDIVIQALTTATQPLSAPEIYAAARIIKKGVKKKSLETTVSKLAQQKIIARTGVTDDGRKLYAVQPGG